jgi:hypothetical protein
MAKRTALLEDEVFACGSGKLMRPSAMRRAQVSGTHENCLKRFRFGEDAAKQELVS